MNPYVVYYLICVLVWLVFSVIDYAILFCVYSSYQPYHEKWCKSFGFPKPNTAIGNMAFVVCLIGGLVLFPIVIVDTFEKNAIMRER